MIVNEGTTDRVIRVILGLVLGFLAYRGVGGTVGIWVLGIVGAVSFLTGLTGFCLVYRLLGIQTCPVRN
jgi:hypothetical protein